MIIYHICCIGYLLKFTSPGSVRSRYVSLPLPTDPHDVNLTGNQHSIHDKFYQCLIAYYRYELKSMAVRHGQLNQNSFQHASTIGSMLTKYQVHLFISFRDKNFLWMDTQT